MCVCVQYSALTLQGLHSNSSTAGCWFYGPGPTPAPPENTAATASSPGAPWRSALSSALHLSEMTDTGASGFASLSKPYGGDLVQNEHPHAT